VAARSSPASCSAPGAALIAVLSLIVKSAAGTGRTLAGAGITSPSALVDSGTR
jgi:hypothetical protein